MPAEAGVEAFLYCPAEARRHPATAGRLCRGYGATRFVRWVPILNTVCESLAQDRRNPCSSAEELVSLLRQSGKATRGRVRTPKLRETKEMLSMILRCLPSVAGRTGLAKAFGVGESPSRFRYGNVTAIREYQ